MTVNRADWRKSSRSGAGNNNCVEVAAGGDSVLVRDSQDRAGPVLAIGRDSWESLMRGLKSGCTWRGDAG
ncbi:DUF397 domain-containing protein [Micromonospora craterilacus]|uniref:DUF397 domain-containing protein n=1 Tax=Micromonospora craterilacus TaxID=1655439 RepID=A0A2W2EZ63_9ACTN|nr:DUF397 domain-containing protein [Micromonospora craterilacus]PZG09534.1 DUF397 domain-containing protein [Micromonospora craterilacus]